MSRSNRRTRNPRIELNLAHREECAAVRKILNDEVALRGKKEPGVIYPSFLVQGGLFISRGVFQSLRPDIAEHLPSEQATFLETLPGGEQVRFHITRKDDREGIYSLCMFGELDSRVHTFYEPQHVAGQGEEHDATYNLHYLGGHGLLAFLPEKLESAKYVAGVTLAYQMLTRVGFELKPHMYDAVLHTCHELYPDNKHLAAMPDLLDGHDLDFVDVAYNFAAEAGGLIRQGFEDLILSADVNTNIRVSLYLKETVETIYETELLEPETMKPEVLKPSALDISIAQALANPKSTPDAPVTKAPTVEAPIVDLAAVVEKNLAATIEKAPPAAAEPTTPVVEAETIMPSDYPSMDGQLAEYRHSMGLDGHASQATDEPTGPILGMIQQGVDKVTDYMPSRNVMLGIAGAVVGLALYKSWAR